MVAKPTTRDKARAALERESKRQKANEEWASRDPSAVEEDKKIRSRYGPRTTKIMRAVKE